MMDLLNANGTTAFIDTVIRVNATSFSSFSYKGPTIHCSNVTINSSLSISGLGSTT
jgi:hypothetical protein